MLIYKNYCWNENYFIKIFKIKIKPKKPNKNQI